EFPPRNWRVTSTSMAPWRACTATMVLAIRLWTTREQCSRMRESNFPLRRHMSKPNFRIIHDLSGLDVEAVQKYLDQVSEFIGLPPELNGLSTILIEGKVVVYARRGTAEILRGLKGISIISVSDPKEVKSSVVFTATGKDKDGR